MIAVTAQLKIHLRHQKMQQLLENTHQCIGQVTRVTIEWFGCYFKLECQLWRSICMETLLFIKLPVYKKGLKCLNALCLKDVMYQLKTPVATLLWT